MNVIKLKKENGLIESLAKRGIVHELQFTSNTTTVIANNTKYIIAENFLSFKELGFVSKVKKYAQRSGFEEMPISASDINYFKYSPSIFTEDKIYFDVVELDANQAYWEIAKSIGYISEEIYLEGLKVDKATRLIALGSMATNKRRFLFDPLKNEYEDLEDIVNPVTRSYFFHIAKELDLLMSEFCEKHNWEGIYFYWVDAFFISNLMAKLLIDFFAENGLEVKEKRIKSMKVKRTRTGHKITILDAPDLQKGFSDIEIEERTFQCIDIKKKRKQMVSSFLRRIEKLINDQK